VRTSISAAVLVAAFAANGAWADDGNPPRPAQSNLVK